MNSKELDMLIAVANLCRDLRNAKPWEKGWYPNGSYISDLDWYWIEVNRENNDPAWAD